MDQKWQPLRWRPVSDELSGRVGILAAHPQHLVGPGAIYQRQVIQEKTNLFIRSLMLDAWCSGEASGSTRHAARSHVDGLRVGVNLQARN